MHFKSTKKNIPCVFEYSYFTSNVTLLITMSHHGIQLSHSCSFMFIPAGISIKQVQAKNCKERLLMIFYSREPCLLHSQYITILIKPKNNLANPPKYDSSHDQLIPGLNSSRSKEREHLCTRLDDLI